MKKTFLLIIGLCLNFICHHLNATVKVFVNNSTRTYVIRIYDNNNDVVSIKLVPGAIQEAFIQGNCIEKIIIQDEQSLSKTFASMSRQVLRKNSSPINEHMTFIIHQNTSVKMYKAATNKDDALLKIDEIYKKKHTLPTLEMTIHTTKTDLPWAFQNISYTLQYNKSFLEAIESLFS